MLQNTTQRCLVVSHAGLPSALDPASHWHRFSFGMFIREFVYKWPPNHT